MEGTKVATIGDNYPVDKDRQIERLTASVKRYRDKNKALKQNIRGLERRLNQDKLALKSAKDEARVWKEVAFSTKGKYLEECAKNISLGHDLEVAQGIIL